MSGNTLALYFLLILYMTIKVSSKVEFTNIECKSTDAEFDNFEYCYLKSVNRSYKYLSIKVNVYKKPITKFKLNMQLLKRFNGYRPFMYNVTVDLCRFMKNSKTSPIANYFFDLFRNFSNFNQSCPFNQDFIVDKLTSSFVNNQFTNVLPFPEGDYCLETHWIAYDVERAVVKVFGTLT